jgi:hypothetical protein
MEHDAGARIDYDNINNAVRQIERRSIRSQVFVLVSRAENLNHCNRKNLQSFIAVRRLRAKDGEIGSFERAIGIGKTDEHIDKCGTGATGLTIERRTHRTLDPLQHLLVSAGRRGFPARMSSYIFQTYWRAAGIGLQDQFFDPLRGSCHCFPAFPVARRSLLVQ